MKVPRIKYENNEITFLDDFEFEREYSVENPELKEGNLLRLAFNFGTIIDTPTNEQVDSNTLNEAIAEKVKQDLLKFLNKGQDENN